jgi:ribosome-associated translation inhibitor RaiA
MSITPQIQFRDTAPSPAAEQEVRTQAVQLDRYADRITACQVVIGGARQPAGGTREQVQLSVALPGDELGITREASPDLPAAIRDAFDVAARLLEDETGRHPDRPHCRERLPHGRVRLVVRDQDLGLLEAADGREVYFRADRLVNAALESLESGAEVVYIEGFGELGHRQANAVRVVGRKEPG